MNLSAGAKKILALLGAYETYVVGGCVRDDLLGYEVHDFDLCTSALPEEIKTCCRVFPVIETGIKHGTVTVLTPEPIEVTTFRVESAYSDGRRPDSVSFTGKLTEDLRRRDFTVNAIAYHPDVGYVDPFHGKEDGERGILRAVGNPYERFEEDALRILRGMRFASRFGFTVEEQTARAMQECRERLARVSVERIYSELCGFLIGKDVFRVGMQFKEILFSVIPELKACDGFAQNNVHHEYDVFEHTLHAVSEAERNLILRLVMLFHDVGKPLCYSFIDGQGHFYGHAKKSAELARTILTRLKADKATIERVELLVLYHDYPVVTEERAVSRLVGKIGKEAFLELCEVKKADSLSLAKPFRKERTELIEAWKTVFLRLEEKNACFSLKDLAIKGGDVTALGFQGREVGVILKAVLAEVLDGTLENEKENLLNFIRRKRDFFLSNR